MKTRLTHVRANVKDLKKAIEWYASVLGLKAAGAWPLENPTYVDFECEQGAVFAIMVDEKVPSHGRFNFNVDDVDALWEEVKDKVQVVEPLFDTPWGTRKFTIKDLDGNELGFSERPKFSMIWKVN